VLKTKETLWKNNVNFLKDALVLFVRFKITVIIVCEKQNRRRHFHTDLRNVLPLHCMLQSQEISTRNTVMIRQEKAADHKCGTVLLRFNSFLEISN
jgi:hypothetical protein